ncbi:MAG: N-acetylglucosamine-6-phosphate deacetylase [Spirochaetia bacterium]
MSIICLHNAKVFTGIATIESGSVLIKDGLVYDVVSEARLSKLDLPSDMKVIEMNGGIVAPGFIDTHVHGAGGFDTAHGTKEDFLGISDYLVRSGVTSFCPTMYPQKAQQMISSIQAGVSTMGEEKGARIHGLHLEGPFISCKQLGVQRPETVQDVDIDFMKEVYRIAGNAVSIMTVAPELKHMRELAQYCVSQGTILSAGHSDATYENMIEGMQSGILHCTHMFNAMRKLHHRDPGLVGAILIHDEFTCEVIADGVHVHPALVKMLMRDKDSTKLILVTDALAPTGLEKGAKMVANGEEVYLGDDGIFHRVKDDVIAGSALTLDRAVRNMISWGARPHLALRMAAGNPATLLRKNTETGYLLPFLRADIVTLDETMRVTRTFVGGELKYEAL